MQSKPTACTACALFTLHNCTKRLCILLTSTVVSRKYAPPHCNLSLSTKRREGLYMGCDNFSHDYTLPSSKA